MEVEQKQKKIEHWEIISDHTCASFPRDLRLNIVTEVVSFIRLQLSCGGWSL